MLQFAEDVPAVKGDVNRIIGVAGRINDALKTSSIAAIDQVAAHYPVYANRAAGRTGDISKRLDDTERDAAVRKDAPKMMQDAATTAGLRLGLYPSLEADMNNAVRSDSTQKRHRAQAKVDAYSGKPPEKPTGEQKEEFVAGCREKCWADLLPSLDGLQTIVMKPVASKLLQMTMTKGHEYADKYYSQEDKEAAAKQVLSVMEEDFKQRLAKIEAEGNPYMVIGEIYRDFPQLDPKNIDISEDFKEYADKVVEEYEADLASTDDLVARLNRLATQFRAKQDEIKSRTEEARRRRERDEERRRQQAEERRRRAQEDFDRRTRRTSGSNPTPGPEPEPTPTPTTETEEQKQARLAEEERRVRASENPRAFSSRFVKEVVVDVDARIIQLHNDEGMTYKQVKRTLSRLWHPDPSVNAGDPLKNEKFAYMMGRIKELDPDNN